VTDSTPAITKYADLVSDWLVAEGYTHCFFVAGGNIMHLLDGLRTRMVCVPVVHEVAAGIAVEYFNESGGNGRAFALVTAGPGLTNIVTAMGGAWLESRELLVIGGQVKSEDLISGGIRQRGIQEIDGVALAAPVCKVAERLDRPWDRSAFTTALRAGRIDRPGPVFLELCLDVQGAPVDATMLSDLADGVAPVGPNQDAIDAAVDVAAEIVRLTMNAERPLWLIGGGVTRQTAADVHDDLVALGIPLMTTWNGADRLSRLDATYVGRPNTWGQRSANVLVSQADLVVVFGSRLGLQQTGFNWQQWASNATVVQIDIDPTELAKGHPRVTHPRHADANEVLRLAVKTSTDLPDHTTWLEFCHQVRDLLPTREEANVTGHGFVDPYEFYATLARITGSDDVIVPCSSGGANSVAMQIFEPIAGQVMIVDKGLASMGYGLGGAIGASIAWPGRRTVLIEGDGGFTQNLQELATVAVNALPIKIFIFANNGYGSIRTTQRNYFGGAYLGCDTETGLGFPDWTLLFDAYGIESMHLGTDWQQGDHFDSLFDSDRPAAFIVPIDPDQTYWPKITSRVTSTGSMESNPLHQMSPDLPDDIVSRVFKYST
jgi:acetolactate synthase-1/2/3 large subunit